MSDKYFKKKSWQSFIYQDVVYTFDHLDEMEVEVEDSQKAMRRIAVTFSDHCFTKDRQAEDDPALLYPLSTRKEGYFCIDRYQHSLQLKELITRTIYGHEKTWILDGENFAGIPTVDHGGQRAFYGIIFSLDRVKHFAVDLHMRVRTAYVCDRKGIITYGNVRFAHLATLRMQGKQPKRNLERNRPRPRLS